MSTDREPRPRDARWAMAALCAGAVALTFDPGQPLIWQWLILALAAAAMTWLLRTAVPVLLAAALLGASHSDLESGLVAQRWVFPGLAAISGLMLVVVVCLRVRSTRSRTPVQE